MLANKTSIHLSADRETAAGKAQCYHSDLVLIYMLPIMSYAKNRQFRVDFAKVS